MYFNRHYYVLKLCLLCDFIKKVHQVPGMPPELVKTFSVDVYSKGRWHTVGEITDNIKRFVPVSFPAMSVTKVRINLKETYGCPHIRLYEVRCY